MVIVSLSCGWVFTYSEWGIGHVAVIGVLAKVDGRVLNRPGEDDDCASLNQLVSGVDFLGELSHGLVPLLRQGRHWCGCRQPRPAILCHSLQAHLIGGFAGIEILHNICHEIFNGSEDL